MRMTCSANEAWHRCLPQPRVLAAVTPGTAASALFSVMRWVTRRSLAQASIIRFIRLRVQGYHKGPVAVHSAGEWEPFKAPPFHALSSGMKPETFQQTGVPMILDPQETGNPGPSHGGRGSRPKSLF